MTDHDGYGGWVEAAAMLYVYDSFARDAAIQSQINAQRIQAYWEGCRKNEYEYLLHTFHTLRQIGYDDRTARSMAEEHCENSFQLRLTGYYQNSPDFLYRWRHPDRIAAWTFGIGVVLMFAKAPILALTFVVIAAIAKFISNKRRDRAPQMAADYIARSKRENAERAVELRQQAATRLVEDAYLRAGE